MAIAAGVLLAAYFALLVYALLVPSRGHDPQRGQAVGCLMIVAGAIALLGGVLGLAVALDWNWLVDAIFWAAVFPVALAAVNAVRYLLIKIGGADR